MVGVCSMRLSRLTGSSEPIWRKLLLAIAVSSVALPQTPSRIQSLVSAGSLDSMRWPNFRDYQPSLQKFYEPVNYAPVWVKGGSPSSQALVMIELLRNAWKKGLEPEDYDASRWDSRLHAMQGSAADPAEFDVALTVCTMRYISDLRIGRIDPQHFKFGLSVEQKKYDLAHFLRDRILATPNPEAALDGVEPPFAGYRRTEQALARYIELASTDDGEKLPDVTKPIEPGQSYEGVPRLTRFLKLVGDLPPGATLSSDPQVYGGALVDAVKSFQ